MNTAKPMLGFAAFSGTGKTTLLEKLIPQLLQQGVRVAMVKHAHHAFEIDKPGKDSYRLRKAGAQQMLIASDQRMALMTERPTPQEPRLDELITRLDLETVDLILVEGFKHVPFPKIELHREALGKTLLHPDDPAIIAIACDHPIDTGTLPTLDINDTQAIAAFITGWLPQQGTT
jgi:molybdopterin-guanine dinucleotide biosynthesis protein MobB